MFQNILHNHLHMNTNSFVISNKQIELDSKLILYDLWATKVHVLMLAKQKIIKEEIAVKILKGLGEIEKEYKKGKFMIDPGLGLHLTLEAKLIEKIGEAGYFMHTARSRNDQVWTAELLFNREKALKVLNKLLRLIKLLKELAEKHLLTVMPGYTHMQPAKPTTFAQWCLAYLDMFDKCFATFIYYFEKFNLSPLGSVESYGTSWSVDRKFCADLLGFAAVWEIPQEAISSRGFAQLGYLSSLKDISIVISKIASDLLLFTTFEFGYVSLSAKNAKQMGAVTGSSVMPQKKNPDVLELLRSSAPQVIGYESIVANILSGLPMGYNRDSREIKEYIENGFSKVEESINCLASVLQNITVNNKKMHRAVLQNFSLATDITDYISQKSGLPYRKVYQFIGQIVKNKIEKGLPLGSLTKSEITDMAQKLDLQIVLTDSEIAKFSVPIFFLERREHLGGSASKVMKKMIAEREKTIIEREKWLNSVWEKIQSAKTVTKELINRTFKEGK